MGDILKSAISSGIRPGNLGKELGNRDWHKVRVECLLVGLCQNRFILKVRICQCLNLVEVRLRLAFVGIYVPLPLVMFYS